MGSITELPALNRRFTYAYGSPRHVSPRRHKPPLAYGEQHLYFVFSDEDLTDEDEETLLGDPLFDTFFPEIRYGAYLFGDFSITDDPALLYNNIEEDVEISSVINGEYRLLQLKDIREACSLPQKYILGCSACMDEETAYNIDYCEARRLRERRYKTLPQELIDEVYSWKHLKKKIGDFTFVSPSSVQDKVFASRIIGLQDIDFSAPEGHRERRREASATQEKGREFKKEHCSICLMSSACGQGQWCDRRYDKAESAYYADISDRATIPFTDKQMRVLLYNSGPIGRYNRRDSYLTFRYLNGALEFVVGGIHRGCEKALTYREALKLLKERGDLYDPPKFKVTQKLKALLVATTSIQENRGPSHGWGHGRFPVRFTKYQAGPETFTQYYYRGHRMHEGLSVTNLQDIYRATYRIPLVVGTAIPRTDRT